MVREERKFDHLGAIRLNFLMSISDRIAELRSHLGITRSEVAKRTGCSVPTIRSVESGTGSIASMLSVIDALGGSLIWEHRKPEEPLGTSLATARRRCGMSQRTMAAMIGVTQPTVVAMERRTHGRMQTLKRYLDAVAVLAAVQSVNASPEPKGRRLVRARNSPKADIVYTPRSLAKAVIDHHPLTGTVLDTCRGARAFFDQFRTTWTLAGARSLRVAISCTGRHRLIGS